MSEVVLHKGVQYSHGLYGYVVQFFMNMTLIEFTLYVLIMSLFGYYINKKRKFKRKSKHDKL